MVKNKKHKYHALPTIELAEAVLLMAKVIDNGRLGVKAPKISDEVYIAVVKKAVLG